ncbi:hypothetical protein AWB74_08417 [Caballeronia arvi]|uniref:DUF2127 domain-containing protein n=1 Tax=Caballeronia arvi TaxID=1777135 RepID=A0A158L5I8_9BURK|nr:DUF2127 domain-containing protein [Caballeronia arvi]SAL88130.1 hypothetical protein AWB74_08417 [Caballeronia arvi]
MRESHKITSVFAQKRLHLFFILSLWCKAILAIPEVVAGVITLVASRRSLLAFVVWVTEDEFAVDPHDLFAGFLLHTVQHLSVGTQEFAAIYLLGHGVIKLWLIVGLLRRRLWYFPIAITVFSLFVAYQLYRYTFTHSLWLLPITDWISSSSRLPGTNIERYDRRRRGA